MKNKRKKQRTLTVKLITLLLAAALSMSAYLGIRQDSSGAGQISDAGASGYISEDVNETQEPISVDTQEIVGTVGEGTTDLSKAYDYAAMPVYTGNMVDTLNNDVPYFTEEDIAGGTSWDISLSDLDELGRCGQASMCVSLDVMPKDGEARGKIGNVKPSGWNQAKYPGVIDENPGYLYNRCHLLAWCLSGLNDEPKNLITGTRSFNVDAMLPYEEAVARYVESSEEHVLYRVTPVYNGSELVARGVVIEARSIESDGLQFCVYAHNVQDGIDINYMDGSSSLSENN